jgi:hypothetical protein
MPSGLGPNIPAFLLRRDCKNREICSRLRKFDGMAAQNQSEMIQK